MNWEGDTLYKSCHLIYVVLSLQTFHKTKLTAFADPKRMPIIKFPVINQTKYAW